MKAAEKKRGFTIDRRQGGDRRLGLERREIRYTAHIPERRADTNDRRNAERRQRMQLAANQ